MKKNIGVFKEIKTISIIFLFIIIVIIPKMEQP